MSKTKVYSTEQLQHAFKPDNKEAPKPQAPRQPDSFGTTSLEQIQTALFSIPADDYQIWIEMGMVLKTHLGDSGYSLWDQWSKAAPEKYRPEGQYKKWCSFQGNDLTIASLFYKAKDYGWKPEGNKEGNNNKQSDAFDSTQPHQDGVNEDWPKLANRRQQMRTPYPIEALPTSLQDLVSETNDYVQAPVSMAATCAIMAIATAAQGLVDVERDSQLISGVSLFSLVVAASGERKSFLDNIFTKPILDFEDKQKKLAQPKIKDYEAKQSVWKAKKRGLEAAITRAAKQGDETQELEQALMTLIDKQPKPPKVMNFYYTDITTEDLAFQQAMVWPSGCINTAEGGAYFGGVSMNKDNLTKAMAYANAIWSGERFKVNRRTSESFEVEGARLSIGLQVQNEPLQNFMQKHGDVFRGIGFLARFLFQHPETTQGTRFYKPPPKKRIAYNEFCQRITDLLKIPININQNGGIQAPALPLSPEAFEVWKGFYNETEAMIAKGQELEKIADIVSKIAENVARLACLFHVYEIGTYGTISARYVAQAIRIMKWHLSEVQAYLSGQAMTKEQRNAAQLESWMIDYCQKNNVSGIEPRIISQFAPNALRKKEVRDATIAALVDYGLVRFTNQNGKQFLELHPELLKQL